jgi:hypothetical protein
VRVCDPFLMITRQAGENMGRGQEGRETGEELLVGKSDALPSLINIGSKPCGFRGEEPERGGWLGEEHKKKIKKKKAAGLLPHCSVVYVGRLQLNCRLGKPLPTRQME